MRERQKCKSEKCSQNHRTKKLGKGKSGNRVQEWKMGENIKTGTLQWGTNKDDTLH